MLRGIRCERCLAELEPRDFYRHPRTGKQDRICKTCVHLAEAKKCRKKAEEHEKTAKALFDGRRDFRERHWQDVVDARAAAGGE